MELSAEQIEKEMSSEKFVTFIDRTSRLMERALCDSSDILFDYIIGGGEGEGWVHLASLHAPWPQVPNFCTKGLVPIGLTHSSDRSPSLSLQGHIRKFEGGQKDTVLR